MIAHLIFYVEDQERSTEFYRVVLDQDPTLHVPGMTEFPLAGGCILGLMPERGIKRLLGDALPDLVQGRGIPRAEIYFRVVDPAAYHARAVSAGAKELSSLQERDWGDIAAYSMDLDGHVMAFAKRVIS